MALFSPHRSCLSISLLSFEIARFSTSTVGTPPRKSIWSDSITACAISCCAWISSSFWMESYSAPLIVEACCVYWMAAEYSHSRSLLSSASSFFMVIFIGRLLSFGVRVVCENGGTHYCPVKNVPMLLKSLSGAAFGGFQRVSDLNVQQRIVQSGGFSVAGGCDVCWQDPVRPDHGLPPMEDLSSHRGSVWRRPPRQDTDLRRTFPHSGLRPTLLSREPARHRGLPVGTIGQALPHGHPQGRIPLHPGRCQRVARLAHLRRVRPAADCAGTATVRQRRPWAGFVQ